MRRGKSWPGPTTKRKRGPKANEPTRVTRADAAPEVNGVAASEQARRSHKKWGWAHLGYRLHPEPKKLYERVSMYTVGRSK